jgi:flagellar basal-body rod protein FlgF/flagellar basal-body rod protein FlgG
MDSGYYAAYSALLARTEAMDAASSNLANANTNGYRAQREYFRDAVAGEGAGDSQLNGAVNRYGVLGGDQIDLGQGALVKTGSPTDVAIQGQGFFAVKTAHGERYTRDGSFQRSKDGMLVDSSGDAVLDEAHKPITMPNGTIMVGTDGAVSVDGGVVDRLGVFVAPATQLIPEGADRYRVNDPRTLKPSQDYSVAQGELEGSNQNIVSGSLQLMLIQRQAEMMQKALSVFHNDFDRAASEDLPKV